IYTSSESTTQTDLTESLNRSGLNIITDFTDDSYTPGIFWSTQDNNPTKPKAGIYVHQNGAAGSSLLFGTSNSWATGITNTALTLGPSGNAIFRNGLNTSTAFQVQNSAGTGIFTIDSGTGATLTGTLYVDTLGGSGTTAICWNSGTAQISSCSDAGANTLQGVYAGGNTILTTDARDIDFTLANTSTDANFTLDIATGSTGEFQIEANGTDILQIGSAGQLQLDVQGSSGGILLGGDVSLYRDSAGILRTDGDLYVDGAIDANEGTSNIVSVGWNCSSVAAAICFDNDNVNLYSDGTDILATDDALTVAGLITANGNFTLQTGDTFTINGDAFTDLTGDGLTIESGVLTVDTSILGGDFFIQGGNSFGETAQLGTLDANSLEILTDGNTVLTISGVNGSATFQNSQDSASAFRVSNTSGHSILTVNTEDGEILLGSPNNLNGTLVFGSSSNSNTTTITATAPSTNQSILLPNASGTVCLTSGNCAGVGGTGDILQGGNSVGAAITLGSNDSFNLNLETDGQTRLTVDTSGNVGIGGTSSGARLFVSSAVSNSGGIETVFSEDFDPGIDASNWTDTGSTVTDTECDSDSGDSLRFTDNDRVAETVDMDVSGGGAISFYLYAPSGGGGNCETPDANENFILEYSTNNGGNWTEVNTYFADIDPMQLINEAVPAGAQTSDTRFRWRQTSWSGTNSDHWAIDTIVITNNGGGGLAPVDDDFDPSIDGAEWSSTSNVSIDTSCGGSASVSGNAMRFSGAGTRSATTVGVDTTGGGIVSFYLYADDDASPCDDPESGDNMVVEYSTNSGGSWNTISEFNGDGGYDTISQINANIPTLAKAASTQFRFRQTNHSGSGNDNWTIDNVIVATNNPLSSVGATIYGYNNSADTVDLLRLSSDVGGTESIKFRVDSNGNVYADGTFYGAGGVTTGQADLAEVYRNHDGAQPGDVVVFSDSRTVEKSNQFYQTGLAGVVSTDPGVTLNINEVGVPVALSGRVPVSVSVANGTIQKGDYLTSGPGGVAVKATSTGTVIGTALEDATEDGKIDVFVHVGHYNPADDALFDDNVLLALQSSDVTVASLNTSGRLNLGELNVEGEERIFLGEYGDGGSGELQLHAEKGFHFTTGENAENEVFSVDENGYVVFKNA
ncbi:MAG: hypothetical protein WD972_02010, partial [Candidatus Andersenbacteria bacterium]